MHNSQNCYRSPQSVQGARARQRHPIVETFCFLADCCYDRFGKTEESWHPQEYMFPFSCEDSEVTFSEYYGDCHYNILCRAPKVLSYRRRDDEEDVMQAKIEALLGGLCDETSANTSSRLEVDFVKMLLTCPTDFKDESVTMAVLKRELEERKLRICTTRVHLPSGSDALVGVLEDLGAILTKTERKSDTLRCVCFMKKFLYRGRSFESSLFIDPTDLVFCDYQSSMFPGKVVCFANPGSESGIDDDVTYDLRIKAKTLKKVKDASVSEESGGNFRQMLQTFGRTPPSTLTEPGLDGLFRREGDGYEFKPEAHINELLEKTNKVAHHFEMEGFTVVLMTCDGREFKVDKSGRSEVKNSFECWPKLMFILDDVDRLPALADLAYRCVVALFNALSDRRLDVQPWRCFGNLPGGVNVSCVEAQILRRIRASDSLEGMLGVTGARNARVLANRLTQVLRQLEDVPAAGGDLDPVELRRKLVAAAREAGIGVEKLARDFSTDSYR